jgi:hypothetical protein
MTASFHVEHATRASRIGTAAFAAALVLLAAAPAWGGRDDLRLLSEIYAYVAREPVEFARRLCRARLGRPAGLCRARRLRLVRVDH